MTAFPPQGISAAGGSLTGVTEDGGSPNVVTVADALNVGTATDATAAGDFAVGLTGAGRMVYDQSTRTLTLTDASGNPDARVMEHNGTARLEGAVGVTLWVNGAQVFYLDSSRAYCQGDLVGNSVTGAYDLGTTTYPWGALTLGDGTAQANLSHDGATDGKLVLSDPNGAAGAQFVLTDAAGNEDASLSESSGFAALNGALGVALRYAGLNRVLVGNTTVTCQADGAVSLGTSAIRWASVAADYAEVAEGSAPAGATDAARIYAEADAGGKTRLMVAFQSGDEQEVVAQDGGWQSYTPSTDITNGAGKTSYYRRQGGLLHVQALLELSGAAGGTFTCGLPSGLVIDTAALPLRTVGNRYSPLGECWFNDYNLGQAYTGTVVHDGVNDDKVLLQTRTGAGGTLATATASVPFTWAASDEIMIQFSVPVKAAP